MSERAKKTIGAALLFISISLITWPLLSAETPAVRNTVRNREWVLKGIPTERNGSVRVNGSEKEELIPLPGIGTTYAERIIDEKRQNGPFHYPEDLVSVSGIGRKTLAGFREYIDMTIDESGN